MCDRRLRFQTPFCQEVAFITRRREPKKTPTRGEGRGKRGCSWGARKASVGGFKDSPAVKSSIVRPSPPKGPPAVSDPKNPARVRMPGLWAPSRDGTRGPPAEREQAA